MSLNRAVAMEAFGREEIKRDESAGSSNAPVFGIDLGTTNSAISVITQGDNPEIIQLVNGKKTMPSCVMWKDGEFIVGDEAYMHRDQANVIYSVKRFMQRVGKKVTFKDGSRTLEMTPAEVSAEILKGLVAQTGGVYGEVKDVVVTVPAYFDQNGRNATREACELAGLNLLGVLNEPTAAALCYDVGDAVGTTDFVTFDFGGGTFDATLARIVTSGSNDSFSDDIYGIEDSDGGEENSKTVDCLAISGDSYLGGDDIDRDLLEIVLKRYEELGIDTSRLSRSYKETLLLRLENLKKHGADKHYQLDVDVNVGSQHFKDKLMIGPEEFRASLMPSYKKCKKILDKLLRDNPNDAKKIVLVGGSTKNPLLVEELKKDYPNFTISNAVDQDLAVSLGAAIKGKITRFGSDTVQVFDILPMNIGVLSNDAITTLIKAGTTLPATATMRFTNMVDNQKSMKLEIMQGNSKSPEDCVRLGFLRFTDLPEGAAGEIPLSVSITITAESQMKCIGTVNDDRKEMILDLNGEAAPIEKASKDAKLIARWTRAAEKMDEKDAEDLKLLIKGYPEFTNKKDIMDFIKNHSKEATVRADK